MVPPDDLFGVLPTWVGVYLLALAAFGAAAVILYQRVVRLVLLGRPAPRLDRLPRRLLGALPYVFGQRKVLQSFSPFRDWAGLAHFVIFWSFLSFSFSYVLFIFGDSLWRPFSSWLLTEGGVRVLLAYLDVLAVVLLVLLAWAALRRWVVRPRRLSYDLTQKAESAVILLLIGLLMVFTLLTEAFYVAAGGEGVHAEAPIGAWLGRLLLSAGIQGTWPTGSRAFSGGPTWGSSSASPYTSPSPSICTWWPPP